MDYLILDTDTYMNLLLKRASSVPLSCGDSIKNLLESNRITIILPEIIQIEFERNIVDAFKNSKEYLRQTKNHINNIVLPHNFSHLKESLLDSLKQISEALENADIKELKKPIDEIMKHPNTEHRSPTSEVLLKAFKRIAEKKAPAHHPEKRGEADCLLFETMIEVVGEKTDKERAFFVTHNRSDFSRDLKEGKNKAHPDIVDDLDDLGITYDTKLAKVLKEKYDEDISEDEIQHEEDLITQLEIRTPLLGTLSSLGLFVPSASLANIGEADDVAFVVDPRRSTGPPRSFYEGEGDF